MSRSTHLIFYKVVPALIFAVSFLFYAVGYVHADTPRVEQLIKSDLIRTNTGHVVGISCAVLSGSIESITVSLTAPYSSNVPYTVRFWKNGESFTSPLIELRRSNTAYTGPQGVQQDVTFTFPTPINVAGDLCAGTTLVRLLVDPISTDVLSTTHINGSLNNPHPGAFTEATSGLGANADAYFIINGTAQINHSPILNSIGDQVATEGSMKKIVLSAKDQDQVKEVLYSTSNLPPGAIFSGNTIYWIPKFNQAGIYSNINAVATDEGNGNIANESDTETFSVQVNEAVPVLPRVEQLIKSSVIKSNYSHIVGIPCSVLSGNIESITLSLTSQYASGIPYTARFWKNGESFTSPLIALRKSEVAHTGPQGMQQDVTFTFPTPIDVAGDLCAGTSFVRLLVEADTVGVLSSTLINGSLDNPLPGAFTEATSGIGTNADAFFIINGHVSINAAPELLIVGNKIVSESDSLEFVVSSTDPDNDMVSLSVTTLPNGASFNAETGEFIWTPGFSDAGEYELTFTVNEDTPEALSDSETITITVTNTNRAPELAEIEDQIVNEGDTLSFIVSATDPDGDDVTLSATNLPNGASFNSASGEFSWGTGFSDAGNYPDIEFVATDDGSPMELDIELVTITVGDVNRMPVLENPGPQDVLEQQTLTFTVSASDPDGDEIVLSAQNLPLGANFNSATGEFSWTPSLADSGIYGVTFIATDDGTPVEFSNVDVVITVGDDPTPVEQTQDIIEEIVTFDLPQNVENSYMANLQKVEQFILEGKINAALNQLEAVKTKVIQDYQQGRLTQTEYQALLGAINNLISDLTSS